MLLSPDQVRRVAALSRIELNEAEAAEVLGQLNGILALVGVLQAADTEGVEPMAHPAASMTLPVAPGEACLRLREDRVTETDRRSLYQSIAPQVEQGLYLVPKVIE
jgi:aspartyl-tRNA(Asn)/glutamyl-tRNA(Gln) amidotransferase subunit C